MSTVLDELLQSLNSRDSMAREDALRDAGALPFRAKLQLFRMAAERYRRQLRRHRARAGLYVAVCGVTFSLGPLIPQESQGVVFWCMIAALCAVFVWTRSPEDARRQMTLLAQNIEDPRFVMPLLKLLYGPEQQSPDPILTDVLKRLLPRLRIRHAHRWSHAEKELLLEPLNNRNDPDLTLCMLKALEQVGDAAAIPVVSRLAEMRLYDERIAEAARECLPFLRSNTHQLREAQTLLRAARGADVREATLLRPAEAVSVSELPDELLRPTETADN